jgi:hypothetical protein
MGSMRSGLIVLGSFVVGATVGAAAVTYDSPARKELKRADLSGAPGMEVISSVSEYKKGDFFPRHIHHGIEAAYVIQGTMVQVPGKEPMMLETSAPIMNLRDVPHAGFTIIGDQPFKIFTVHIVDKGKPLYDWVK